MCTSFLRQCPRRHLFLHMDINKTIIQVDAAGGRTMEDVLHSNAAANVMGYVDDETGVWVPLYGPSEQHSDDGRTTVDDSQAAQQAGHGPVLAYDTYVDQIYSEPEAMQKLSQAERDAMWKTVSSARRNATRKFALPGEVGCDYSHLVEQQRNALRRPRSDSAASAIEGTELAASNYYSIIPGFFHLINTLSELDWPFTLIFRTFGSELPLVLNEWGEFVRGRHTCQPRGPVLQAMKDNYVQPRSACVYRERERSFLCCQPTNLPVRFVDELNHRAKTTQDDEAMSRYLQELLGCSEVSVVTPAALHEHLLSYYAPSNHVGGLVDYYPFWAQSAERRSGGKVYPVTRTGDVAKNNYYVFFDDNIFIGKQRSIVDVRDISSGASIEDPELERKYCVPVNAYRAIVEPNYFIECLCDCLRRQQATE